MRAMIKSFHILVLRIFIARNYLHVNKILVDFSEARHEN